MILCKAPADAAYLRPGDCVEVQCWLMGSGSTQSGAVRSEGVLRRRNVYVAAAVESTELSRRPKDVAAGGCDGPGVSREDVEGARMRFSQTMLPML